MTTSGSRRCARDGIREHAVSFGVARGEILGVAGLVGAGRSEVAAGDRRRRAADRGDDRPGWRTPVAIADPADAIRQGVFLVPEDRRSAGLVVASSIRENVSLPALHRYSTYGLVSEAREREGVSAICRQLQVKAPSIDVTTATLSGGNQQKVVLAKWLVLGPKVLIVDEPTRGIDVGAKAEIYKLLRDLAAPGRVDRDDQQRHGGSAPPERPRGGDARGPADRRPRTAGLHRAADHGARRGGRRLIPCSASDTLTATRV